MRKRQRSLFCEDVIIIMFLFRFTGFSSDISLKQ